MYVEGTPILHGGLPVSDPVGKHRPGLRVSRRHRGHPGHPEAADGIEQPQQLGVVGPEAPNLDTCSIGLESLLVVWQSSSSKRLA